MVLKSEYPKVKTLLVGSAAPVVTQLRVYCVLELFAVRLMPLVPDVPRSIKVRVVSEANSLALNDTVNPLFRIIEGIAKVSLSSPSNLADI